MERNIVVTIQDGKHTKFKELNDILYNLDTKNNKLEDTPSVITIQSLVSSNDNSVSKDNIISPITNYSVICSLL